MMKTMNRVAQQPHQQNGFSSVRIAIAQPRDLRAIFRMRHAVYACELGQHQENPEGLLTDAVDGSNHYIVATKGARLVGFVSITPPSAARFAIEKYITREELPFPCDDGLYEVRLLTVDAFRRGREIAALLMYAALRWVETQGGQRIMAIGRSEILGLYLKVGLQPLGRTIHSGRVAFEALSATVDELKARTERYTEKLRILKSRIDWQLDVLFEAPSACFHGGAFWASIGARFDTLESKDRIINADVLDAWYPPAPKVLEALGQDLSWLLRTSPPAACEGLIEAIAIARGLNPDCLVPGAGSSSLIFQAFRHWLNASSRVLVCDPVYGEYTHVLEQVIGCRVDRLVLSRQETYRLDPTRLVSRQPYDLIVLVNPNNPTGQHVPRAALASALASLPAHTKIWVDEAYIDYVNPSESLESFAMVSRNVIVCKSMSKVYGLSGARVGYLCAPQPLAEQLRFLSPPWAVSLPAQVAAVAALQAPEYYAQRYQQTRQLHSQLSQALRVVEGLEVLPGVANFVLCHLPLWGPNAEAVTQACRAYGVFIRDLSSVSQLFKGRAIRIAVKDAPTIQRVAQILAGALA